MTIFALNAKALAIAISQIYVAEQPGIGSNPQILQYAKDCGFKDYTADDISWCALFMNWVAHQMGVQGTYSLRARSFEQFGEKVIVQPAVGDIVVLWRGAPDALTGHVGLFLNEVDRNGEPYLRVLGGNQGDQVKISEFPKSQLLQFRRWI